MADTSPAAVFSALPTKMDRKRLPSYHQKKDGRKETKISKINTSTIGILEIPTVCRIAIFGFLDSANFLNCQLVCKEFYQDSKEPGNLHNVEPVFEFVPNFSGGKSEVMLERLCQAQSTGLFNRYHRLIMPYASYWERITVKQVKRIVKEVKLLGVTSLDLSQPLESYKKERTIYACIPKALSTILPHLRCLDLSNAITPQRTLDDFTENCPMLERITWHNCPATFLTGQDMRKGQNLKELYMDDSVFFNTPSIIYFMSNLIDPHAHFDLTIFFCCKSRLERVSVRNMKVVFLGDMVSVNQSALVKFVLMTPTLRWFRSNLTAENISSLKAERPELELLN